MLITAHQTDSVSLFVASRAGCVNQPKRVRRRAQRAQLLSALLQPQHLGHAAMTASVMKQRSLQPGRTSAPSGVNALLLALIAVTHMHAKAVYKLACMRCKHAQAMHIAQSRSLRTWLATTDVGGECAMTQFSFVLLLVASEHNLQACMYCYICMFTHCGEELLVTTYIDIIHAGKRRIEIAAALRV